MSAAHTVAQAWGEHPCQLCPCQAARDTAWGQSTSSCFSQVVRAGSGQESRWSSASAGAPLTAALGGAGRRAPVVLGPALEDLGDREAPKGPP